MKFFRRFGSVCIFNLSTCAAIRGVCCRTDLSLHTPYLHTYKYNTIRHNMWNVIIYVSNNKSSFRQLFIDDFTAFYLLSIRQSVSVIICIVVMETIIVIPINKGERGTHTHGWGEWEREHKYLTYIYVGIPYT